MDTRTTSADFYPGGKTPVTAGGGITSGEGEAYNGEQRVPITSIEGLPERFTEGDMKSKIDDICKVLRTGGLALAAILSFPAWGADGITVHGARKDKIFNDGFVVTNVTADLSLLTTNDVCNIVTNEVAGGRSEWMWHCENPEIEAAINANPPTMDFLAYVDTDITSWGFIPPEIEGFEIIAPSGVSCDAPKDATYLYFAPSYRRDEWSDEYDGYVEKMYYLTATRERITRNALGLAMMKDLEKLPTHETVTNVARSVVNSVWDASLGVAWEARMHNGHLYYIAVTNRPPEGK